jgi:hypothetical protein
MALGARAKEVHQDRAKKEPGAHLTPFCTSQICVSPELVPTDMKDPRCDHATEHTVSARLGSCAAQPRRSQSGNPPFYILVYSAAPCALSDAATHATPIRSVSEEGLSARACLGSRKQDTGRGAAEEAQRAHSPRC